MTDPKTFRQILLLTLLLAASLMFGVFAYMRGLLPPRVLVIAWIAVLALYAATFYRIFRSAAKARAQAEATGQPLDEATRKKFRSSVRKLLLAALAFAFFLIYGFFATVGEPLWTRLIGVAIDLFIIYACVSAASRLQRKLR